MTASKIVNVHVYDVEVLNFVATMIICVNTMALLKYGTFDMVKLL